MKNILLIRPDKAGDAVKSLPALRAARACFPKVQFSVLCSKHNASLFAFEPGVRVFQLPGDWEHLTTAELKAALASLPFPEFFDKSVNLLCDVFPAADSLLSLVPSHQRHSLSLGLKLMKPSPAGTPEEMNTAYLLGQALQADLISELEKMSRVPALSSPDREEALSALGAKFQKRFAICPFAGTDQRSHSLRRWRRFIKQVARRVQPAEVYLLGSKREKKDLEFLRDGNSQIEILFPSSFRALGAYIEKMDGVIAIDSGPLHLTQALGIPSLGILSGGDFKRWFSTLQKGDHLLPRGIFSRYPGLLEMLFAFRKWCP